MKPEHHSLLPKEGWTMLDYDLQTVYMVVYMTLREKLNHLSKGFLTWDRKSMDDLVLLLERTEDMDRYNEFLSLVERSLEEKKVRKENLRDSPLKLLRFLLKTRERRPKWTLRVDKPTV